MGELEPKFKIRAPLRCDGIGRLDCAEDVSSGTRLAVRWLPLEANGDAAVKACERLPVHPTLPRIHQTGLVGASAFVAMDFPEGQVLGALVGERLDVDVVIRVGAQLSDALASVHEQGVVHGELSTESVLLVPPDRAYLWDMPLVIANRMTDRRGESRLMQNLPRSAAFLAPERAQGSGASMEGDVYALGAVLCVVAGAPLPGSSTTLGVVHQVATGAWLPRVPTTIPDPWRSMLTRMVCVDPALRPTAREVAAVFAKAPQPAMMPTVPEMPVVRLPPELMAAAEALARKPVVADAVEPGAAAAADAAVAADGAVSDTVQVAPNALERGVAPVELPAEAAAIIAGSSTPTSEFAVPEASLARTTSDEVPEVASSEVVKLPTIEMPAVQMQSLVNQTQVAQASTAVADLVVPPAPRLTPMSTSSVKLADNILVAPELIQEGAVTLTADQVAELSRTPRWVYVGGGLMAAAIVALTAVAMHLATKQGAQAQQAREAQRQQLLVPAQVPVTPTPVRTVEVDDDLAPIRPARTVVKKVAEPRGFDMPERRGLASEPTEL